MYGSQFDATVEIVLLDPQLLRVLGCLEMEMERERERRTSLV